MLPPPAAALLLAGAAPAPLRALPRAFLREPRVSERNFLSPLSSRFGGRGECFQCAGRSFLIVRQRGRSRLSFSSCT